ncbi:AAA family ATPase [Pareuzebyella sediminis]|uniref:AAA family ATPase n=1 Tax=Pareuzebyella sediminis TaxID=2607998 RepID=UPI0011EEDAF4|nr:AAA family ATPase [Pareuzebyella sediminis]
MKVLIFGASGSGTTTLGKELAERTDFIHLDADDYYWKKTNPPFQEKILLAERNENLNADFIKSKNVVLSGSMVSWGKEWQTAFDLAIFLHLDNDERMRRLRKREEERYGTLLATDKKIRETSRAFLEWANQYENPDFDGRSFSLHKKWMKLLKCEIIEMNSSMPLMGKVDVLFEKLKLWSGNHS